MIAMAVGGRIKEGGSILKGARCWIRHAAKPAVISAGGAADRARRAGSTAAPPKAEFKLLWGVIGASITCVFDCSAKFGCSILGFAYDLNINFKKFIFSARCHSFSERKVGGFRSDATIYVAGICLTFQESNATVGVCVMLQRGLNELSY